MKKVAQAGGGRVISPKKKALKETAQTLLPLVRTQHRPSYAPPAKSKKQFSKN